MDSPVTAPPPSSTGTTIVTQTRVRPERADEFARWQEHVSEIVAGASGFVKQTVLPPSPPAQVDWVILQRFSSAEAALGWLRSDRRQHLVDGARPMLVGQDDVHLVNDGGPGVLPAPVSAVISTRIKPGREDAYRRWEQKIAAAQAKSPGFQGYRFEPPVPGVQEDWLAVLRFDSEADLQTWMDSPERRKLLDEAAPLTAESHARIVRTGFDQWFAVGGSGAPPPAWKQNMLVLLMLYPVVFLFGAWVQAPLLMGWAGMPFWLALFIGNIAGVLLLTYLVPWVSVRFEWWLRPAASHARKVDLTGAAIVSGLYALCLAAFSQFP